MSKNTTTSATAKTTNGVSRKQAAAIKKACNLYLHVELLDLPEVEPTDKHKEEAKALVDDWKANGWKPKAKRDAVADVARQLAFASALEIAGVTSEMASEAIGYSIKIRNRGDVSPTRKAEGFSERLGLEGRYNPPASETTTVTLDLPQAPTPQLGGGAAFGQPAMGRMAASPAVPGTVSNTAIEVASRMAMQGMTPDQIQNALAGLRAAGML